MLLLNQFSKSTKRRCMAPYLVGSGRTVEFVSHLRCWLSFRHWSQYARSSDFLVYSHGQALDHARNQIYKRLLY